MAFSTLPRNALHYLRRSILLNSASWVPGGDLCLPCFPVTGLPVTGQEGPPFLQGPAQWSPSSWPSRAIPSMSVFALTAVQGNLDFLSHVPQTYLSVCLLPVPQLPSDAPMFPGIKLCIRFVVLRKPLPHSSQLTAKIPFYLSAHGFRVSAPPDWVFCCGKSWICSQGVRGRPSPRRLQAPLQACGVVGWTVVLVVVRQGPRLPESARGSLWGGLALKWLLSSSSQGGNKPRIQVRMWGLPAAMGDAPVRLQPPTPSCLQWWETPWPRHRWPGFLIPGICLCF